MGGTLATARSRAMSAFMAGINAADPGVCLRKAFAATPPPPPAGGRYIMISIGKAACAMVECALELLPTGVARDAIAVTNYENNRDVHGCTVLAAGHPVPDANGLAAGRAVTAMLDTATAQDVVIALISGGSSALLPAPDKGLTLQDKIDVNTALLAGGLDITDMNLVRQSLSALKGGGMLHRAAPASVVSFILSDVIGDDLRAVGSGPTVGPIGTRAQARALLSTHDMLAKLPPPVQAFLNGDDTAAPLPETRPILIGGNGFSLREMATHAGAEAVSAPLVGDVAEAARIVLDRVLSAPDGPLALAFGGETTVNLRGRGQGGRNQELALRVALLAKAAGLKDDWCFLSGGTDGRDGPTDAAGGLVDSVTLARIAAAGLDIQALLADNDSYRALDAAGDLIRIETTGTNVADLQLFLRG